MLSFLMLWLIVPTFSKNASDNPALENVGYNQHCMACHGQQTYYYYNDWVEKDIKERMNPYFVIDSTLYYQSNHASFKCIDCHSMDYETFPHDGELRMEEKYSCMDCHGGDDSYAEYNFEGIEKQYLESVHSQKHSESFNCWLCHDPHTYKTSMRNNVNLKEVIDYSNQMCLNCHNASGGKYILVSEQLKPGFQEIHNWLPNQELHFKSVRCLECHTQSNDTSVLISHNITEVELAVKKCVECHSKNSLLMASLYKHQNIEQRSKLGFFNASILNESYIIGANRNYYLNLASIIITILVVLGIGIHTFFRIKNK